MSYINASLRGALATRQSFYKVLRDCFATLAMTAFLFFPAHAEPSTYSPDFCEFSVTFPAEPYTAQRCEDETKDRCYNLVSYTQTYALHSTVNFRVICNPIESGVQKKYDENVSKATVRAMGKRNVLETYNVTYREEEDFRQAGLVGEGQTGRTPMIYIAQLWVGKQSVMSVEAELIGDALEEPDKMFSEVMSSVGVRSNEDETEPKTEAETEESENASQDDAAK